MGYMKEDLLVKNNIDFLFIKYLFIVRNFIFKNGIVYIEYMFCRIKYFILGIEYMFWNFVDFGDVSIDFIKSRFKVYMI